ncbi:hypothetical protein, partial [Flammeovirga aprica]
MKTIAIYFLIFLSSITSFADTIYRQFTATVHLNGKKVTVKEHLEKGSEKYKDQFHSVAGFLNSLDEEGYEVIYIDYTHEGLWEIIVKK